MKKVHLFFHNNYRSIRWLLLLPFILVGVYFLTDRYIAYPLQFTSPQNVLREPPVFHLDEAVDVEAIFINTTKEDVTFAAAVHWVLVSPLDPENPRTKTEPIQLGLLATITPGCQRLGFSNRPPQEVIDITEELFTKGHNKVTWRLTGDNVVTSPKGRGSMTFNVDEFTYIPDNTKLPNSQISYSDISCEKVNP